MGSIQDFGATQMLALSDSERTVVIQTQLHLLSPTSSTNPCSSDLIIPDWSLI